MATKDRPTNRCRECGWTSAKWVGRCGECQAWGTVEQVGAAAVATVLARAYSASVVQPAKPITQVSVGSTQRASTGVGELDRVLGGGLVADAVILLAGDPGIGKSTLLLQVAAQLARKGRTVLYITGEESCGQVRLRAERTGALDDRLLIAAETDLSGVLGQIEAVRPDVFIVDSVQTISTDAVEGIAGGVSQVRTVTAVLTQIAKANGRAALLVGHVTKDGAVAGPRTLEHLVDVVLSFEGEPHSSLRMLRAVKNRFGAVDEVGCFAMVEEGIAEVLDPSGLFLTDRTSETPGTAVTVALEGRRPLVVEVQALVATGTVTARRVTSGLPTSRVSMIAAVLERRAGVQLGLKDLFAATVGGVRLGEPAADLAVAMALATATVDIGGPLGLVAIGEIGLAGDVRGVPSVERRLREAARLGFSHALVPASSAIPDVPGMTSIQVATLREALAAMGRVRAARTLPTNQGPGSRLLQLEPDLV